jgi:hypothetical protein
MSTSNIDRAYTVDDALRFLDERVAWLTKEIHGGGNFQYLNLKREECAYIASCIRDTRKRIDGEKQSQMSADGGEDIPL